MRTPDELAIAPAEAYRDARIDLLLGARATALDTRERTVTVRGHGLLHYERLIVATGASRMARTVGDRLFTVVDIDNASALRAKAHGSRSAVVVGAGYTGSEVASSLVALGLEVALLDRSPYPIAALGPVAGNRLAHWARAAGLNLRVGTEAVAIESRPRTTAVRTAAGDPVGADLAVWAVGPGGDPAVADGLDVATGGGIVTDAHGRTADPRVFAAGHVARVRYPSAATPVRFDGEAAAYEMGSVAAASALGLPGRPLRVPAFTRELFGVTVGVVGVPALGEKIVESASWPSRAFWAYERAGRVAGASGKDAPADLAAVREQIGRPISRAVPSPGREVRQDENTPSRVSRPRTARTPA